MTDLAPHRDESLPAFLARRARGASDLRLALDLGLGAAGAAAVVDWQPAGWPMLLSAAICFAAYGAWGIADRELRDRAPGDRAAAAALRVLRGVSAGVGALSAAALILGAIAFTFSGWIS